MSRFVVCAFLLVSLFSSLNATATKKVTKPSPSGVLAPPVKTGLQGLNTKKPSASNKQVSKPNDNAPKKSNEIKAEELPVVVPVSNPPPFSWAKMLMKDVQVAPEPMVISSESSSEDVEHLSSQMNKLIIVEGYTHAWLTTALIYVAQDCWDNVLNPAADKLYPKGRPKDFSWAKMINKSSSERFKFCVKAVDKRTAIIKSDKIFKFLPTDLDTTFAILTKRMGNVIDKDALKNIMTYADEPRLNETSSFKSTLINEDLIPFKLTILGLDHACEYFTKSGRIHEKSSNFCKLISDQRDSEAHATGLSKTKINALINELVNWEWFK